MRIIDVNLGLSDLDQLINNSNDAEEGPYTPVDFSRTMEDNQEVLRRLQHETYIYPTIEAAYQAFKKMTEFDFEDII